MSLSKPTTHANCHYGIPKRVANFMISSMKCQLNESLKIFSSSTHLEVPELLNQK